MRKEDWYRNRILWRAGQHKLFEKRCVDFPSLPKEDADLIIKRIGRAIDAVLVFYQSREKWTVLDTSYIYSFHDGALTEFLLDDINKQIALAGGQTEDPRTQKKTANFLRLKATDQLIWVPEGDELFSLWNILRMFPLRVPD